MLLTNVLREEWGFSGYVISDEMALENIRLFHDYTQTIEETCQVGIRAGCNLEDGPPVIPAEYRGITNAVLQGLLTEDEVREAIKPLFFTRMRLGQFDPPVMNPYATLDPLDYVQSDAHRNLSLFAAMRSFVLLKNNNLLPLPAVTKFNKLAIVGPMSDSIGGIFGNYAPDPDPAFIVTPLDGLSVLGETVAYAEGCRFSNHRCPTYDADTVIEAVTGADFVIICAGTGRAVESEQNDRPDIDWPGFQGQLVQDAVNNAGNAPVLLLLFNGGPLDITWAKNHEQVRAIIECFFPAQTTGEALRRVILNEGPSSNPAGRLPNTWPASINQVPPMVDYSMAGRTYRYFNDIPMYPFGYGLSYSRFHYIAFRIHPAIVRPDQVINIEVDFANDGPLPGEEVVQVYVSWNNLTLPSPRLQLIGFSRHQVNVLLVRTARFQVVPDQQFLVWDDVSSRLVVLEGSYTLYAGGQQPGQATSAPSNVLLSNVVVSSTATAVKSPA